jgi:CheY-specific phosphatase CheX
MSDFDTVVALLQQSTLELLQGQAQNATLTRDPTAKQLEVTLAGIVGFVGEHARGSVMLAMSDQTLERMSPAGAAIDRRDWVGELSNQLVGRFKNKLLAHSVDVGITTPIVIGGSRLSPTIQDEDQPHVFSFDAGRVHVWLDLQFARDFVLPAARDVAVMAEGEAELF